MITFEDLRRSEAVATYIQKADDSLSALGYTEHSFSHVTKAASMAGSILEALGYPKREAELARIAGYLHDIGNIVNRVDHAQSGAVMAFRILDKMGMDPGEIADVISAIGNHDEGTAMPVNPVAAALILADKTDVRRSRVRNRETINFDIHDRVNYSVEHSAFSLDAAEKSMTLDLTIDTALCPVMDYFEIFLQRMLMCKRSAEVLHMRFKMTANGNKIC